MVLESTATTWINHLWDNQRFTKVLVHPCARNHLLLSSNLLTKSGILCMFQVWFKIQMWRGCDRAVIESQPSSVLERVLAKDQVVICGHKPLLEILRVQQGLRRLTLLPLKIKTMVQSLLNYHGSHVTKMDSPVPINH